MKYKKICRCLQEIENGIEPTRNCVMPCTNQIEILEERKRNKKVESLNESNINDEEEKPE